MLLPPDLRDWVAEDDLVHFIIEAVERLPLSAFAVNDKGCGGAQFPPRMMLALLIYCYANGLFGSRRIERATHREDAHAERRYDWRPLDKIKAPKTHTDPVLLAMAEKLKTPEGKATYPKACLHRRTRLRHHPFGKLRALRQSGARVPPVCRAPPRPPFGLPAAGCLAPLGSVLRGLQKIGGKWNLLCLASNLKRLHTLRRATLAG